ncbi:TraC family protein [Aliarcobacter butzleri]
MSSLTQKNWRALLEEEPISDFLNVIDYAVNENASDEGIFYCQNGYRGFGFFLEPSPYSGQNDYAGLSSYFDLDLPIDSAIQIISFPSRNLESIFESYHRAHTNYSMVKEKERIQKHNDNRLIWLKSSIKKGLINNKYKFYPKNWVNLTIIMIPEKDTKTGKYLNDSDIFSYKSKALSKLADFKPKEMLPGDLISSMQELLEPFRGVWHNQHDPSIEINKQIISTSTKFYDLNKGMFKIKDETRKNKDYYCQVLTTKKFPVNLNLGITQNLFIENFDNKIDEPYLKTPFFNCVNIIIVDKQKEKRHLQTKSKNNQWQTKLVGPGIKFFPKLQEIDKESQHIDYLITNHNETIYKMQHSICVLSDSISKLEEQVSMIESRFSKKNWDLQTEIDMNIGVFLYSLPFQYDTRYREISQKFKTTLRGNNAAATGLLNDMKGSFHHTPLAIQFGRTGQVQFFDNFGADGNANIVVSAGSRSGKTFWILDFVAQSLSAGRMVRIIEAGKNFEALTQEFGGLFLNFTDEDNTCLNFFTDARTLDDDPKELHPDEIMTIVPLIGLIVGKQLISTNDDDYQEKSDAAIVGAYVERAVRNAYRNELRQCGLYHVKKELEKLRKEIESEEQFIDQRLRDLIIAISPYADEGGRFYQYFNGQRNVYFGDNPLVVFELNDLKNKDENLMFVVLMALIKIVANEFYGKELEDILKNLICDEAWMILNHPFIASFLIRIWRTIGKHKGAGVSISQDINLYFKNTDMQAIYDNSTYKVYLKQNNEQIDRLVADKKLTADTFLIEKMKSLKSRAGLFSEMLVQVDGAFFISRIIVDRFSFYLYSTPEKVQGFNEVMKALNLKKNETSYIFSLVDTYKGMTIEKAYEILQIEKGLIETNKDPFEEFIEKEENIEEEEYFEQRKIGILERLKNLFR